uniref:Uncharacterized protein n=1 Tax=Moniliophthora roreri TaxID=221103 RepID=A0A0W0FNC0_MONRR
MRAGKELSLGHYDLRLACCI